MYVLECFGDNVGFGNDYTFYVFRNKKTVGELIKYLDEHCSFFKLEYIDQKPLENIIDKVLPEFSWQANPFIGVNFKELEFAD